jgi:thiamine-phosphate pyrophosphorylase
MLKREDLLLYLCTDRGLSLGRPITETVEAAIAGGVTMVQLREKDAPTGEFYAIAREVQAITRAHHIPLVINDRLDIALAIGAEGLHIGQSDLPLREARHLARGASLQIARGASLQIAGDMFIGVSVSTVEEALAAEAEGADYLGAGAVYPTGSKADAGEAIGIDGLAEICAAVRIPVVGIGGINAANTAAVLQAGAAGIAVISAIVSQPDIQAAARSLRAILNSGVK